MGILMGVWRYCECGAGQDQLTIQDLEAISYDEDAKVRCEACDEPRTDDTPAARTILLVREIKERDERLERVEKQVTALIAVSKKLAQLVKGATP